MCLEFSTLIFFALSFHTGIPVRSRREPFLYPTEFHGRDTSKYTFLKYFHGDVDWLARAERLLFVRFPTFIQRVLCVMYSLSNTDDNIIVNWVRMWRTRYRQVQLVWESLDAGIVRTIKYKKKKRNPAAPKTRPLENVFFSSTILLWTFIAGASRKGNMSDMPIVKRTGQPRTSPPGSSGSEHMPQHPSCWCLPECSVSQAMATCGVRCALVLSKLEIILTLDSWGWRSDLVGLWATPLISWRHHLQVGAH